MAFLYIYIILYYYYNSLYFIKEKMSTNEIEYTSQRILDMNINPNIANNTTNNNLVV